jgi:hypothetical protein
MTLHTTHRGRGAPGRAAAVLARALALAEGCARRTRSPRLDVPALTALRIPGDIEVGPQLYACFSPRSTPRASTWQ